MIYQQDASAMPFDLHALNTFVDTTLGALGIIGVVFGFFWRKHRTLVHKIDEQNTHLTAEIAQIRQEIATMATQYDIQRLATDVSGIKGEIKHMGTTLTAIQNHLLGR